MAPKEKKTKDKIAAAAAAGGKAKKKKWSKVKQKEKLNNLVYFDKATAEKMVSEIPKSKLITPSIISERLKVNVSLARRGIRYLYDQGIIKPVGDLHHAQVIYTRRTAKAE
eukprot:Platyproteum_vivax@DN1225_c0_g1_i1.p1